jgi:hypothetical protein
MKIKKVCNYCGKTVKGGGIHRIKEHLAHARGQVEPCTSVSAELKAEMQNLLESFQVEKAKTKKIKKDIGKSQIDDAFHNDPEGHIPSFEESSSFPVGLGHRDEHVSGPSASSLKRARKGLDSFFVPCTTPGSQPTIDAKWKKIEKELAWECIARWWYDADIPFNATNFAY